MLIINPGTEAQQNTTEANAVESAKRFARSLNLSGLKLQRIKNKDSNDGWYGFQLKMNKQICSLDVPGVEPDIVEKGEPWVSPRLYVDGSSWLWGYALGSASDKLIAVLERSEADE